MRNILSVVCVCAVCCVPVLAQSKAASKAPSNQQFVDFAAQTDMMEAHLGQLAADQAMRQDVKDFAQMLMTDHTSDYSQLQMAAMKAGVDVPKGLDAAHNRMIAPFEKLKGAAFDARFIREMISGHKAGVAEYMREAESGDNPDLKAYANMALPTLMKHLDAAEMLEKTKSGK